MNNDVSHDRNSIEMNRVFFKTGNFRSGVEPTNVSGYAADVKNCKCLPLLLSGRHSWLFRELFLSVTGPGMAEGLKVTFNPGLTSNNRDSSNQNSVVLCGIRTRTRVAT